MYVSGRGTDGYGTILPAIAEWKRKESLPGKVVLVGTNGKHSQQALHKTKLIQEMTGVSLDIEVYPNNNENDREAYIKVLDSFQQPTCVIVAVPDHLHYQVIRASLEADFHTLVVKPLTPTVEEARELTELAERKGLYGMVEFHKRWDRHNLMLRDVFRDGRISDPLYCWVEYSQRKSIPEKGFSEWVKHTNPLQYLGVHYIDIVYFALGAIPVRAMGIGQRLWLKSKGIKVDDAIQCMIEWEMPSGSRFNQVILTNWIDPETSSAMSEQKIKLVGTTGRFESDQKERGIKIFSDGKNIEEPNPDFCHPYSSRKGKFMWKGYGIDSIHSFLNDTKEIYSGKKTLHDLKSDRPTFRPALISTAVIEAINQSIGDGNSWVKIKNDFI